MNDRASESVAPSPSPPPLPPSAEIVRRRRVWSWAWLVPLAALVVVGVLVYQVRLQRGTIVTIRFQNGEGLRAGDPVSYRGVRVGEVRTVRLDAGLGAVVAEAELTRDSAPLAVEGSTFWIVRPEVSLTRISGLDTLLGPRYIAVQPGAGAPAAEFVGLDQPPEPADLAPPATPGLPVVIAAPRLGSLGIGSAITYRGIRVGSVTGFALSLDARTVDLTGVIDADHAHLVRANSRFWDAGRIGLDWGILSGVTVKAGSIETILAGGISFATPTKAGDPVASGHRFTLEPKPDDDWLDWSPDLTPPARPR
jgi:paraquat-inducible protein B